MVSAAFKTTFAFSSVVILLLWQKAMFTTLHVLGGGGECLHQSDQEVLQAAADADTDRKQWNSITLSCHSCRYRQETMEQHHSKLPQL